MDNKSKNLISDWQEARQSYLRVIRGIAMDSCANALQLILFLQKESVVDNDVNQGNLLDAKKCIIDAVVNLAISASGRNHDETREILSAYRLEDMI